MTVDSGSLLDVATIICGFTVIVAKAAHRRLRGEKFPATSVGRAGADFLNGVLIVPFMLLIVSAFSNTAFLYLIESNKVLVSLAGAVGLIFVMGELVGSSSGPSNGGEEKKSIDTP